MRHFDESETVRIRKELAGHPCFDKSASRSHGRIHLPVAPKCNIQCGFCNRAYSCVNESRPGVTARVMDPGEALSHLKEMKERAPYISVAGIAGPGDPFANPRETLETLRLVKREYPEMLLCVSTNGLNAYPYVAELRGLGVSHVTVTVNAMDEETGSRIYSWIEHGGSVLTGRAAAIALWECQRRAIWALARAGIIVKVNTVLIPGVNEASVPAIAESVAALGASVQNVIPLIPVAGTRFGESDAPEPSTVAGVRAAAERYIPQMDHCSRCRADAAGLLGEKNPDPCGGGCGGRTERASLPAFVPGAAP